MWGKKVLRLTPREMLLRGMAAPEPHIVWKKHRSISPPKTRAPDNDWLIPRLGMENFLERNMGPGQDVVHEGFWGLEISLLAPADIGLYKLLEDLVPWETE